MIVLGTQQSPVNIVTAETFHVDFGASYLQFRYHGGLRGHFDTHKQQFIFDPPTGDPTYWSVTFDERQWIIRQVHIHTPAEHLIDSGRARPHECHLLHSLIDDPDNKGDKLVIGVFLAGSGKRKPPDCGELHELDPSVYLPKNRERWYRYEGSLTSWGFTEDVSWVVMADEGRPPADVMRYMTACANQVPPREVYPLNRRFVLRSFTTSRGDLAKRAKGKKATSEA
jgi:carbonic anhydrase